MEWRDGVIVSRFRQVTQQEWPDGMAGTIMQVFFSSRYKELQRTFVRHI